MVSLHWSGTISGAAMSVLRSIESKLESLFEGVFGRAFRSNVQPVELARKLVKEMDDHRSVSVSRVYVPNEYTVYLSPADRDQFADYERTPCEASSPTTSPSMRGGSATSSPPSIARCFSPRSCWPRIASTARQACRWPI